MNYKNYKDHRTKFVGGSFDTQKSTDGEQNDTSKNIFDKMQPLLPGDIILNNIAENEHLHKIYVQSLLYDEHSVEDIPYKTESEYTSIFDLDNHYENTLNDIVDEAISGQKGGSRKINQKGGAYGDAVPYNVLNNDVLKTNNIVDNILKVQEMNEYFCNKFFPNAPNAQSMKKTTEIVTFLSKVRHYVNVDQTTGRHENLLDHPNFNLLHPTELRNPNPNDVMETRVGYSGSEFATIYGQQIIDTAALLMGLPNRLVVDIRAILSAQDKNADKLFISDVDGAILAIRNKVQVGQPIPVYYFSDVYYLEKNTKRLLQDGLTTLLLNFTIVPVLGNNELQAQQAVQGNINAKNGNHQPNYTVTRGNMRYVTYLLSNVHSNLVANLQNRVRIGRMPEHELIFKGGNACKYYMKNVYDYDNNGNPIGYKYMEDNPNPAAQAAVNGGRQDFYTDLSDFDFDIILTGHENEAFGRKIRKHVLGIFERTLKAHANDNDMDFNSSHVIENLCQEKIIDLQDYNKELWRVAHKILTFYNNFNMNDNDGANFKNMVVNGIGCFNEILNSTLRGHANGRNIDNMVLNVVIGNVQVQVSTNDPNINQRAAPLFLPGMNPPVAHRLNADTYCSCNKKQQLITKINNVDTANVQNTMNALPGRFVPAPVLPARGVQRRGRVPAPPVPPVPVAPLVVPVRANESANGDVIALFAGHQSIFSFVMLENVGGCSRHRTEYLLDGFDLVRSNIRLALSTVIQQNGYQYLHRLTSKAEVFDYGMSNILSSQHITMSNDHHYPNVKMHGVLHNGADILIPTKSPRYILIELITLFVFVIDAKRYKRLIRILTILDNALNSMDSEDIEDFMKEKMVQASVHMFIKLNRQQKPEGIVNNSLRYLRNFLIKIGVANLPNFNYLDMVTYIQTDGLYPNNRSKYLDNFFKYAGVPDNQRQQLIGNINFNGQNDATNINFNNGQYTVNGQNLNPKNSPIINSLLNCMMDQGGPNGAKLTCTVRKNNTDIEYKSNFSVVDIKNVLVL